MKNLLPKTIILSAFLSHLSLDDNLKRNRTLKTVIKDLKLDYKQVMGVYKGDHESSLVLCPGSDDLINIVSGIAFEKFEQESVLVLDSDRFATLHYNSGLIEKIGKFKAVSVDHAFKINLVNGSYTFDSSNDQYYIIE